MPDPIEINVRLSVECVECSLLVGLADTNEEALALADKHRERHHQAEALERARRGEGHLPPALNDGSDDNRTDGASDGT